MKSCHLPSAYRAPDTTPNTFPASLLWCLDNVVKRAALPSSQSGKLRGTGVKSLFQSLGQSKWLSWDVNQSFSASKSLSVWNKDLLLLKEHEGPLVAKFRLTGKQLPTEEGRIDGEEAERWVGGTSPSYTHCGERKERLPRRQPQLFHSASIRRWKMTTT